MKKLILLLIMFAVSTSYALGPVQHTGTLDENFVLQDLDGNTIDLFELLDKDVHVLVFQMSAT